MLLSDLIASIKLFNSLSDLRFERLFNLELDCVVEIKKTYV